MARPVTTLGQLLVNEALPEPYRDYGRQLDRDTVDAILAKLAKSHPDRYRDVSHKLVQLGRETSYLEGSTLKLHDLSPVIDRKELLDHIEAQEAKIDASTATPEEKEKARDAIYAEVEKLITDQTYEAALAQNNPFAIQVKSKARGNKQQLAAMLSTPATYRDSDGRSVPMFIRHSYAEGLSPAEYWAASYGARLGLLSTKFGVREGGYLGKQLGVAAVTQIVTADDCGTPAGIPVRAQDNDNIGAVLARPVGGYPAGTVIDKAVLADLNNSKVDEVVVRSPATCALPQGLCKICVGHREDGRFPRIGDNIGLNAASAIAERIAQGSLNTKHCIAAGAMVKMSDGKTKVIEDIRPGDMVMGCTKAGVRTPVKVVAVHNNGRRECWRTVFAGGLRRRGRHSVELEMISTLDHKVWSSLTLKGPRRLRPVGHRSQTMFIHVSHGCYDIVLRRRLQEHVGYESTYDLTVDHPDHMYVLGNGIVVSNSGKTVKGETTYSGFPVIEQLVQIPEQFPSGAAIATADGAVESVTPAPQGGNNVIVNGVTHYVPAGLDVIIKPGDVVEAGDQLSQGIVNPADVVQYKGIGEGRRYFADRFTKALRDSAFDVNRRNAEVISRAVIDHVHIDDIDGAGAYLPGDIVSYGGIAATYRPRKDAARTPLKRALGQYLEEPVLHHTIGTRITAGMVKALERHGITDGLVHSKPPGFSAKMLSLVKVPAYEKDWMAQLGSNYLESRLLSATHRGAVSDTAGLHPIPAVAQGLEPKVQDSSNK